MEDEIHRALVGHLLDGSAVYTTAEVVLVALDDLRFTRRPDPSGHDRSRAQRGAALSVTSGPSLGEQVAPIRA